MEYLLQLLLNQRLRALHSQVVSLFGLQPIQLKDALLHSFTRSQQLLYFRTLPIGVVLVEDRSSSQDACLRVHASVVLPKIGRIQDVKGKSAPTTVLTVSFDLLSDNDFA